PVLGCITGALTPGINGVVKRPAPAAFGKRTVSVYSAEPSPSRLPHERQNLMPKGIGAPHCAQTTVSLSGFAPIPLDFSSGRIADSRGGSGFLCQRKIIRRIHQVGCA